MFEADDVVDPLLEVEDAVLVRPLAADAATSVAAVAADHDAEREEGVDVAEVGHHRLQRNQESGLLYQFLQYRLNGQTVRARSPELAMSTRIQSGNAARAGFTFYWV